jgi:hypothetical protein
MTDINELFARDPEHLTKADIAEIISKYREARQQFILGVKQAGNPKKIKAEVPKLTDLSDLDID